MGLLGTLVGIGIPYLRRPVPMLFVHLHVEPMEALILDMAAYPYIREAAGIRNFDSVLHIAQKTEPPATLLEWKLQLPLLPKCMESVTAVLRVTRVAPVGSLQLSTKLDASDPRSIPYNVDKSPFFDRGVGCPP